MRPAERRAALATAAATQAAMAATAAAEAEARAAAVLEEAAEAAVAAAAAAWLWDDSDRFGAAAEADPGDHAAAMGAAAYLWGDHAAEAPTDLVLAAVAPLAATAAAAAAAAPPIGAAVVAPAQLSLAVSTATAAATAAAAAAAAAHAALAALQPSSQRNPLSVPSDRPRRERRTHLSKYHVAEQLLACRTVVERHRLLHDEGIKLITAQQWVRFLADTSNGKLFVTMPYSSLDGMNIINDDVLYRAAALYRAAREASSAAPGLGLTHIASSISRSLGVQLSVEDIELARDGYPRQPSGDHG